MAVLRRAASVMKCPPCKFIAAKRHAESTVAGPLVTSLVHRGREDVATVVAPQGSSGEYALWHQPPLRGSASDGRESSF